MTFALSARMPAIPPHPESLLPFAERWQGARDRLFNPSHAFENPATVLLVSIIVGVLAVAPPLILLSGKVGRLTTEKRWELWVRWRSWLVLVPLMGVPVLLGAFWTMPAVTILSLLCYREYSRATGLFREKFMSVLVVLGILLTGFATVDHWYHLFEALFPLTVAVLAGLPVLQDRPAGYIQRVALAVFGFALFGSALGHLGYLANDVNYRPILLLVLTAVELNDVAAFVSGRLFGRAKLVPHTSPNKTVAGAVGALLATTLFVTLVGRLVFAGTNLESWPKLIVLGFIISFVGQIGDLVLSSLKRDLGLKDLGRTIPGHGGLLDRFDSLILVAPAVFHYVNYFVGIGLDGPICIFSGARS